MGRLKFILLILAGIIIILVGSFFLFKKNIINFLSVNNPVNAEYLIVEGWISENSLNKAVEEFVANDYKKLVVTGAPIESWYMMAEDGYFIVDFQKHCMFLYPGDSIIINLKGTKAKENFSHFSLQLNNEKVGGGYTTDEWEDYLIISDSALKLTSLTVIFDNDDFYGTEDRNLYIGSVRINNKLTPARSENTTVFNKMDLSKENPIQTNYSSVSEIAAHYILSYGVPADKMVILSSKEANKNRTLNSAIAVDTWVQDNQLENVSMNVFSENIHSRRSWMVYKSVLHIESDKVGVILPSEESDKNQNIKINNKTIVREILGIMYYAFLGLF